MLLFLITLFLAYANGSNDNFKGVATLYGSGTLSYRSALGLATVSTLLGSLAALAVAGSLVSSFSGRGLVPDEVAGAMGFLLAIGFGVGVTVLLATALGFPISTTHALIGALSGTSLMAIGGDVNFAGLGASFLAPLLISPFIAFILAAAVYGLAGTVSRQVALIRASGLADPRARADPPDSDEIVADGDFATAVSTDESRAGWRGGDVAARDGYSGAGDDCGRGTRSAKLVDSGHIVSGAAVSFARGLNDTPKIAGLIATSTAVDLEWGLVAIGLGMATGGLLQAARVAQTMSTEITTLTHGQGLTANIVTSFLVIFASKFGMPVSTTHVSVGSIVGIGTVSGSGNLLTIKHILLAWLVTLPTAAIIGAAVYGLAVLA